MTSPIGKIKQGRKIKIGSVSRYRGKVFPIAISGKIAYIQVSDLDVLDGSEVLLPEGHDSIVGLDIHKNRFVFAQTFFMSNFLQGQYSIGQVENTAVTFSGFTFKKERVKKTNHYYNFGFEYLNFSSDSEKLSIPSLTYERGYIMFEKGRFKVRGSASIGFSPYAIYTVNPYFALNGFSYHGEIAADLLFYLHDASALTFRGGYRSQTLTDFNLPTPLEAFAPQISGPVVSLGYSHSF